MTNEELVKQFYDSDKCALHNLYEQNTSFIHDTVNAIVKRYRSFIYSIDTLDDLFQIASLEFIERLMSRLYDPDMSAFLTYIKPYIEAKVRNYVIDTSSLFKLSHKSFSIINRCKRLHKNGKSNEDIAAELGISEGLVDKFLQYSFVYSVIIYGSEDDNYGFDYITEDKLGVNDLHPDNDVYFKLCGEYIKPLFDKLSKKGEIYVLDEPSTGLHGKDIEKLLTLLRKLVTGGNTVVIVEHRLELVAQADYIIDMGPEGGSDGGEVMFSGTPEELLKCERSKTGEYLRGCI